MNLLIVSENFLNGGLETQINTMFQNLKGKITFFFAVKNYDTKWNLPNIYTNFHFSNYCTINQFCEDVDNLIQIIQENNIDIIHVHPFYSFFPAVFAAKICKIPVVYTYQGISSYNFTCEINDTLLFNLLLDYEVDKIFCVSSEGDEIFKNIVFDKNKITFLPNSIDLNKFGTAQMSSNKSWALVSRLDDDKISSIKLLLKILNSIDINELHIFGDGTNKNYLQQYISENNLNKKVFLEGHCDNLSQKLSKNFNGIMGIGRVAMEAISMGMPILLIGYNKISGMVDSNIYHYIKYENFTNKNLPNISLNKLKEQISQIYNGTYDKTFYNYFKEEFSSNTVSNLYYNELEKLNFSSLLNLQDLYNDIKSINDDDIFYNSFNIYTLLKKYFSFYIRQPHQKNLFIIGNYLLTQQNINNSIINHVDNSINSIKNEINSFNKKFDDLSENSMTLANFKRKLKYKFNKKLGG